MALLTLFAASPRLNLKLITPKDHANPCLSTIQFAIALAV
jgi:hypothetical protein